jgi:hypothetical protein
MNPADTRYLLLAFGIVLLIVVWATQGAEE